MNEYLQMAKDWAMANKGHAAVIAACTALALFVDPLVAGLVGAGYIAYRLGYLDKVIEAVKAKIGG